MNIGSVCLHLFKYVYISFVYIINSSHSSQHLSFIAVVLEIGAAGIPGSDVMTIIVLQAVNLPLNDVGHGISLVFWETELDTSLSSSICQPSSVCRNRARGLSLFRENKVKIVIELDDLSSSVFQEKKKREKFGN